jgi:hypothetical protein
VIRPFVEFTVIIKNGYEHGENAAFCPFYGHVYLCNLPFSHPRIWPLLIILEPSKYISIIYVMNIVSLEASFRIVCTSNVADG